MSGSSKGEMSRGGAGAPPQFDSQFSEEFSQLIRWRRDVRRFQRSPLPEGALEELLSLARFAPSVGLSQPWRYVVVESAAKRAAVRANFEAANAEALNAYDEERASLYARLKLAGLDDAPEQLAVFCDSDCMTGHGLGRRTMPEMLEYSVVMAVHTLWLAARARGIGVGWVSILDPGRVARDLGVPDSWRLVAYLCIGYPVKESIEPELEAAGWEIRQDNSKFIRRV